MLFGEALGASEEERGRPFVGDAGRKLNYLLERAGLNRKSVRIENVVRCRPPGNRKPGKKQVDACWPYSLHAILRYRPRVIVAMGATAVTALTEPAQQKRGRVVESWRGFYERRTFSHTTPEGKTFSHTCWVVPTYHPSLCLRKWEADDLFVFDMLIAVSLAAGEEPLAWPDTQVEVLRTASDAVAFLRKLRRVDRFATDIEDTTLDVHRSKVVCAGFCYKAGHATILPLHTSGENGPVPMWSPPDLRLILDELATTLAEARLIGQNIKYDIQRYRKLTGLTDFKVVFDTMVGHFTLDENKPHNLTFLCQWFLGWKKYDATVEAYKDGKTFKTWLVPDDVLHRYCGYDVDGTFRLAGILEAQIEQEGLRRPNQIGVDLIVPLADLEYRGVHFDTAHIRRLADRYRAESAKALKRLRSLAQRVVGEAGAEFNPGSSAQLGKLLKAAGADLRKKTKGGGSTSVDKFVLAALSLKKTRAGAIARAVLTFRKMEKYVGTYLDGVGIAKRGRGRPSGADGGFLRWVGEYDRAHPNYNIAIARTGRLSCDDPAIQTLPRTGNLRAMVVPDDKREHRLVAVDYEKLELCVMAWLASDGVMVEELFSDIDLHTKMAVTARLMRNPTAEEYAAIAPQVTKNERAIAKGVNFGIPYGRGAAAIAEANPDAFPLGMAKEDRKRKVQRIVDAWLEKYWRIAEYRERQIEKLHAAARIVTTVHRRVRHMAGMDWFASKHSRNCEQRDYDLSHMEREALNCEVQSIGSDTLSEATRRAHDGIRRVRIPGFRIVMSLHDALLYNVHKDHTDEAQVHIKRWMEVTLPKDKKHKYEVPLRVDCSVQAFWGEGES